MARLTEQGLHTFERGAYRHTLTELGDFSLPPYMDDDELPLPDLTKRTDAAIALALQAICEHRLGCESGITAVMTGPYWDNQGHIGQTILDYGVSFRHNEDGWLLFPGTLQTISKIQGGQAILFEIALELLKSDQLKELDKLTTHLEHEREQIIVALKANISREPLSGSQIDALKTAANHPVVDEILSAKARDRLRINVLTHEIIQNNVTCARPTKNKVKMEHLVFVLAQLRTGSATSGELFEGALYEKSLKPGYTGQIILALREILGADAIDCKQNAYRLAEHVKAETDLDQLAAKVETSPFQVLRTIASAGHLGLTAPFVLRQIDSIVRGAFVQLHEQDRQEGLEMVMQISGWVVTLSNVAMISPPTFSVANQMN